MKNLWIIVTVMICSLFAILYHLHTSSPSTSVEKPAITVFCASGLRKPVEEIASLYEREYNCRVLLDYGGSGQLLSSLQLKKGDLFIPADASYIELAKAEGMVVEHFPVSHIMPVIMVPKGNPLAIKALSDLSKDGLRVAIADRSAAVGKLIHQVLETNKLLEAVEQGKCSKFQTVNEVATQVQLGAADLGVVWDCLMKQYPQCEMVRVPELDAEVKMVSIGLLSSSANTKEALKFCQFMVTDDRSIAVFKKYGFQGIEESIE